MKHCRLDYEAIQPWPTKRPHYARTADGNNVLLDVYEPDPMMAEPIIPDDEPVFVLRAKDMTAPHVVRFWCDAQIVRMPGSHDVDPAREAVIDRVRRFADEMADYAARHYAGGKEADTPLDLLRTP